jgi:hypothetical protein
MAWEPRTRPKQWWPSSRGVIRRWRPGQGHARARQPPDRPSGAVGGSSWR